MDNSLTLYLKNHFCKWLFSFSTRALCQDKHCSRLSYEIDSLTRLHLITIRHVVWIGIGCSEWKNRLNRYGEEIEIDGNKTMRDVQIKRNLSKRNEMKWWSIVRHNGNWFLNAIAPEKHSLHGKKTHKKTNNNNSFFFSSLVSHNLWYFFRWIYNNFIASQNNIIRNSQRRMGWTWYFLLVYSRQFGRTNEWRINV